MKTGAFIVINACIVGVTVTLSFVVVVLLLVWWTLESCSISFGKARAGAMVLGFRV